MMHFIIDTKSGTADGMMLSHIALQLAVQSQLEWQSSSLEQPKSFMHALYCVAHTPSTTACAQLLHADEGGPPPAPLLAEVVTAPVLEPTPAPAPVVTPVVGPAPTPEVGPAPDVVPAPAPEVVPAPAFVPWAALVTRLLAMLVDAVPPAPVAPPAPEGSTVTFEPQAPVATPIAPTATKLHRTHFMASMRRVSPDLREGVNPSLRVSVINLASGILNITTTSGSRPRAGKAVGGGAKATAG